MQKTTQETINNIVWRACDTFRGTMDSNEYKDYVLTMLFVKYLSDFYKEKLEELHEKYKGNEERIAKSLKREKFVLDEMCTFDYLLKHKEAPNVGEIINKALERIEEDNKEKLEGIFRNVDFNSETKLGGTKERNAILKHLLEDFANEKLISSHISQVMPGRKEESSLPQVPFLHCSPNWYRHRENFAIYGQEKNGQTHALCKMNMFLHEINDANIAWGDTLRNPLHIENDHLMKFDVVVANPPFSLDKWGAEDLADDKYGRFRYGLPPKSKGDYAFVEHMLASLNAQGRMGVVLPHGVLFRGASEGKIRKGIIDDNLLDAVIGLPANLFFGTGIPATILIFKKGRSNTDVLFIDASREFNKDKNQNSIDDEHIAKILDTYKNRKEIEKYSHIATLEEIQENDYNLNIPRYVDTFEEEEPVDIEAAKAEIAKIEAELSEVKKQMQVYLEELGL